MLTSRNHGNSENGKKSSSFSNNNQKPWQDMFVTSNGEVFVPCATDVIFMLLHEFEFVVYFPQEKT